MIPNKTSFYGEELLAPLPNPKLKDHLLSAVRECLLNIFAATVHTGSRSSIRNLRTRHAVVTGNHISWLTAVLTGHYFFKLKIIRMEKTSNKNKSPVKLRSLQIQRLFSLCISLLYLTTASCHITTLVPHDVDRLPSLLR
jgi:hypothetical protein